MYFSVTEVAGFKRCRRQWDYSSFNRMALTPIMQPKPYLDLGTLVHKTLAYWTEKPDLGVNEDGSQRTLRQVFTIIAAQHRAKAVAKFQEATGRTPTSDETEPLLDAIVMGGAMMENYQEYYGVPLPAHLKFCVPEQEILIPIAGTEHPCKACFATFKEAHPYLYTLDALSDVEKIKAIADLDPSCKDCYGTGQALHYLKARLDALAQDRRDNVYVVERKTYDKRPDIRLLEITDQFIGYIWCAQQLDVGRVIGLAYDGMWKRAVPPQKPKKLTLADLFVRTMVVPRQSMVEEYGEELAQTVNDMANDPHIYKNRVWQGCWDCSYEQLCRSQSEGDDIQDIIQLQYTRRTEDDADDIVKQVAESTMLSLA